MDGIKLHILECGSMGTDMEQLLGAPPYRASRQDHNKPATWISASLHAVLIEHPDGLLLWDTAVTRDWENQWAGTGLDDIIPYDQVTDEQYLDSRLKQIGIEAAQIDMVVFSHLHMDHAGNLGMFKNGHTRLLAHADEITGAMAVEGEFAGGHIRKVYEGADLQAVRGDTEIFPGVTLLEAPGHTFGTMSLMVELPNDGTMIFTSDAIYLEETLQHKHWGAGVWDNRAWLASVDKILGIAEKKNAQMIFGHDSRQLSRLRTSPDGFYS